MTVFLTPKVELVYQDASGSTAALTFRVAPGSTVSEAVTAAEALAASVSSLTGAVLVRRRIRYEARPDSPGVAAAGSSITHTGAFYFDTGSDIPGAIVTVPGFNDALLLTGDPCCPFCIDRENADILTFVDALVAAGICNPFGDACTILTMAYLISRV